MLVFNEMEALGHEKVVFVRDENVGLKAIIAIHSTVMGPALGGLRIWDYASDADALFDVLRLSRGMSLKNAGAKLKLGGAKMVIIGDINKMRSREQEIMHAAGRAINSLGGEYIAGEDVNCSQQDLAWVKEITPYVTSTPDISGNPAPATALGVYMGMKAACKSQYGTDNLKGKVVTVSGLGNVGSRLLTHLHQEGAVIQVYDIKKEAVEKAVKDFGAKAINADEVLSAKCDVLAPCALGAVLNTGNIGQLNTKVVCGSANNILLDSATGDALDKMGILFCPDYIVNAGGVINSEAEGLLLPYSVDEVEAKTREIYNTTLYIIDLAKEKGIPTYAAADEYALGLIAAKAKEKQIKA